MDDIEKNRVAYVSQLEAKLKHLQSEHDKYKTLADKWEPKLTVVTDPQTKKVTFGLEFGGKRVHATVTDQWLAGMDSTSATSTVVDALVESLVVEKIRTIVAPELERVQRGAIAMQGAGKW